MCRAGNCLDWRPGRQTVRFSSLSQWGPTETVQFTVYPRSARVTEADGRAPTTMCPQIQIIHMLP